MDAIFKKVDQFEIDLNNLLKKIDQLESQNAQLKSELQAIRTIKQNEDAVGDSVVSITSDSKARKAVNIREISQSLDEYINEIDQCIQILNS